MLSYVYLFKELLYFPFIIGIRSWETIGKGELFSCHDCWNSTFCQSFQHTNCDDRLDALTMRILSLACNKTNSRHEKFGEVIGRSYKMKYPYISNPKNFFGFIWHNVGRSMRGMRWNGIVVAILHLCTNRLLHLMTSPTLSPYTHTHYVWFWWKYLQLVLLLGWIPPQSPPQIQPT